MTGVLGVAAAGSSFATWAVATAVDVAISGGDLVATNTGTTSSDQGVLATSSKSAGKFYFEITITNLAASGLNLKTCWGLAMGTATYTGIGTNADDAVTVNQLGSITCDTSASGIGNLGQRATGDVIGIAIDFTNQRIWFRVAPSGLWNGNAAGDPATNVNGANIAALSGSLTPVCTFGGLVGVAGNVNTANFGATAFSGAVPSGFTSGWTQ